MRNVRTRDHREPVKAPHADDGRTKQAMSHETDVRNILKRYADTGNANLLNAKPGYYADLSSMGDYLECLTTVEKAREMFNALPASTRDHFANDPALLLAAFDDPDQRSDLEDLGLLEKTSPSSSPATAPEDAPAPAAPAAAAAAAPATPKT